MPPFKRQPAQQQSSQTYTPPQDADAYQPDDFELQAINLVKNEKTNYETASKDIRVLIKKARQNYMCMFENPYTSSKRKKTFIPMTRWEVDTIVPKIFVNDKALTVVPEVEDSTNSAFIMDKTMKHQMKATRFPTYFRNSMYDLGIDGTTVFALYWDFERSIIDPALAEENLTSSKKNKKLKTDESKTKFLMPKVDVLKDQIGFKQIDVLNCFIDPTADSIQEAPSFIYRNVLTKDQVQRNKQYRNTNFVHGYTTETFNTYDARSTRFWELGNNTLQYQLPMVGVYERWGRFPKSFITKNAKDASTMIDGVITVGDMEDGGVPVLLRIMENPFKHQLKPFEECWFQKKQGRWYGIGIGEKLVPLQRYLNKSVNRREENEDILHAGVFKVKRGSGISTKSITSVPGGVIEVTDMTDIEQLQTRDISQLSDGTLRMIQGFVERINGASEIAIGSSADRSATTSLIKDRNADTRFAAVRGYVNDFLLRFFSQWMQLDMQFIDREFIIRVTGDETELAKIDNVLGLTPEQRAAAPNFRFLKVDPETIRGEFGLDVDIDQSIPMNKAENADRILKAIEVIARTAPGSDVSPLTNAYLDMIGLVSPKYKIQKQAPIPQPGAQPGAPTPGSPSELLNFLQAQGGNMEQGQGGANTNEIPREAVAAGSEA